MPAFRPLLTRTSLALVLLPAPLLLLGGCGDKAVTYYEVPREQTAPAAAGGMMAGAGTVATPRRPSGPQLEWDKPAAWVEQPAAQMRLASYAFTAPNGGIADISVTAFPDAAGGLIANINRWRGQVGLEPVAEADLATAAESITVAGQAAWFVDFAGTPAGGSDQTRITGAIVPVSGTSWFFKMMGPDAVVASQREAFREMLGSIRAVTPTAQAPSTNDAPADPHAGLDLSGVAAGAGAMRDGAAGLPPPPGTPQITFDAPEGWQEQPPRQFRVINFLVPGEGVPAAEFYVTPLTGAAGGELANVNRWRSQLQLPPVDTAGLEKLATTVEGPAGTFKVFDLASTGPALQSGERARMLAAILVHGDTSWFFRLTGEIDHVAAQRENFEQFLKSFRFETTP